MYVLEDLCWGNVAPMDKVVREGSEYRRLQKKEGELGAKLWETLGRKQRDILKEQEEVQTSMMAIMEQDVFISGFRLGARVILDVLGKYESQFVPMAECEEMG